MSVVARGPMADDHYVKIHNLIVRGAIHTKYVGIYGYIASQSDGWELSAARVATKLGVGRDFVTGALKALEKAGLMIRMRRRDASGRLGDAIWFVTDVPLQLRALGMTDQDLIAISTRAAFDQWQEAQGLALEPMTENPAQVTTRENASLPRSEPNTGFPAQEKPAQGNPAPKKNSSPEDLDPVLEDLPSSPPRASGEQPGMDGWMGDQDGQTQRARELVEQLPPVAGRRPSGRLRTDLVAMVANHLVGGWNPKDLIEEMTRDLGSARSCGVYRNRLLNITPVPPAQKPAATTEPVGRHDYVPGGRNGLCGDCGRAKDGPAHHPVRTSDTRCEHGRVRVLCTVCPDGLSATLAG